MADLFVRTGAALSADRRYRLRLWRQWNPAAGLVNWILLNPSTAAEEADDPTVRRCTRYTRAWGFGGLVITNLFALRATDPSKLLTAEDPVGRWVGNDLEIVATAARADLVVCGWGNHGGLHDRAAAVVALLEDAGVRLHCLRRTKRGQPTHPLYLPNGLTPVAFGVEVPRA